MLRDDSISHVQGDADRIVRDRADADLGAISGQNGYPIAFLVDLVDETDHERWQMLRYSAAYSPSSFGIPRPEAGDTTFALGHLGRAVGELYAPG